MTSPCLETRPRSLAEVLAELIARRGPLLETLAELDERIEILEAEIRRKGQSAETRWVNFYPPDEQLNLARVRRGTTSWFSREDADRFAVPGRLACIQVSFSRGEGL